MTISAPAIHMNGTPRAAHSGSFSAERFSVTGGGGSSHSGTAYPAPAWAAFCRQTFQTFLVTAATSTALLGGSRDRCYTKTRLFLLCGIASKSAMAFWYAVHIMKNRINDAVAAAM